ncbi:thiosulfate/3-mercaptopyruvate sulfurtransferase [Pustulibacterium marinum]|uniref:Thiosulfate/3-mercaptopyruvate sulfurtransferase n=1 Tax=Pustulibacterium marinum TaxID=1224947 RepID=A0A1I7GW05_9FLAO|nr:sulfurtransferase [Pustulibacterium marinum]SFU52602.1 thiosulfate/3-mercaptopyruvate sulfurtransferase [Pustulibacterium marinum]
MNSIIRAEELKELLNTEQPIIIFSGNGAKALDAYQEKHIVGTLFMDLDDQLSGDQSDPSNGGRHPLPNSSHFAKVLSKYGVLPSSKIVIYDNMFGANAAARLWWMFRAIGHDNVHVLSGGLSAAEKVGIATTIGMEYPKGITKYPVKSFQWPMVTMNEVATAISTKDAVVIDVRDSARFAGEIEPIDLIAGHIPNALNIPFKENLTVDGTFKSIQELKDMYVAVTKTTTIIHCGSGVTACHTILAMVHAGFPTPALYVGSWSEWSRSDREKITK